MVTLGARVISCFCGLNAEQLQSRVSTDKRMSIFLISSLGVILVGAAIVSLLAVRRPRFAGPSTGITLGLALLVWLVAGQNLPLGSGLSEGQDASGLLSAIWRVDATGWQLSFYLLLMMEAVVIASLAHFDRRDWTQGQSPRARILFPAILLVSAAALLTVWTVSIAGLLSSWVVLSFAWLLLLWSMSEGRARANRLLPRGGALLLGVLFLWLAVAVSISQGAGSALDNMWSGWSGFLLLLAATAPLGALPLQWWRPLAWSLPKETAAIVHLAPVVAGGSLLTRIGNPPGDQEAGFLMLATALGLIGMLVGISIAWMYVASPDRALSGLALAQAGVVVLAAAWVGSDGVLAATRVLLLAISGLFLASRWSPRKLPWPAIVPLLALAGFPLTAGFAGLATVYDAWLSNQRAVLLMIGSLLSMFLLAAGVLAVRRELAVDDLAGRIPAVKARHYLALALPSLGLLTVSTPSISDVSLWVLVAIGVAIAGSLGLSRYEARLQNAQLALRQALHLGFAGRRLLQFSTNIGLALDKLVREMAAIMEGEGGMLWLLVFVVVIWLARRSS